MLGLVGRGRRDRGAQDGGARDGRSRRRRVRGRYHGLRYGPLAACGLTRAFRAPFAAQLGRHVTFAPYPVERVAKPTTRCIHAQNALSSRAHRRRARRADPRPRRLRRAAASASCAALRDLARPPARSSSPTRSGPASAGPASMLTSRQPGRARRRPLPRQRRSAAALPISACVGSREVMAAWGAHGGSTLHTATHFGSPLACAAALATLDAIRTARSRIVHVGAATISSSSFRRRRRAIARVREVRGRGLMIGIHLDSQARALGTMRALLERGWIVLTGGSRGRRHHAHASADRSTHASSKRSRRRSSRASHSEKTYCREDRLEPREVVDVARNHRRVLQRGERHHRGVDRDAAIYTRSKRRERNTGGFGCFDGEWSHDDAAQEHVSSVGSSTPPFDDADDGRDELRVPASNQRNVVESALLTLLRADERAGVEHESSRQTALRGRCRASSAAISCSKATNSSSVIGERPCDASSSAAAS